MTSLTQLARLNRLLVMGGGNMADAMVSGWMREGVSPDRITVVDPSPAARDRIQQRHGVVVAGSIAGFHSPIDALVWAVKPDVFPLAAVQASKALGLDDSTLHVSVMAGVGTTALARNLGTHNVVRTMPNQAAAVGQGVTGMFAQDYLPPDKRVLATELMRAVGSVEWMESESQLHAVTALSGSGPAFMFSMLKAAQDQGALMGLSAEQALRMAIGTMSGAAALALKAQQSGTSMDSLIEQVRSPNGTTHAGLVKMNERGVFDGFQAGLQAANDRSVVLGGGLAPRFAQARADHSAAL
ncbi:pyrroline-5-carboxylate reductase [Hydrogenophaga sp.]|uniref:pyrroline-5-carboxylate reductase n=1 Tax=Hydrogenophaga sp. TaxID=1904254 RepID=UPI003F724BD0